MIDEASGLANTSRVTQVLTRSSTGFLRLPSHRIGLSMLLSKLGEDELKATKEVLGWEATRTIDDMCADTWRWQSKNPNGLERSS